MYLVIKKENKNQIPLRAYKHLEHAYNFQINYIKDSYHDWDYYNNSSNKEKMRKVYFRDCKNGNREEVYIKFMRLRSN